MLGTHEDKGRDGLVAEELVAVVMVLPDLLEEMRQDVADEAGVSVRSEIKTYFGNKWRLAVIVS